MCPGEGVCPVHQACCAILDKVADLSAGSECHPGGRAAGSEARVRAARGLSGTANGACEVGFELRTTLKYCIDGKLDVDSE